eukprot:TRINITY_DN11030_c0_g1_i12.p1 TRINITY_DN11030_c0_g1~~TRINITY_DN11030_c0_g1_i12.p1  ORF type:complete len:305 (-),score=80.06 TRINITY_DN11030_c0_g1_i12:180-1094(-)
MNNTKALLLLLLFTAISCEDLVTKEGAERIKAAGATWEVVDPEKSVFKGVSLEEFVSRLQQDWPDNSTLPELEIEIPENVTNETSRLLQGFGIPRDFDSRKKWEKCIHSGRNQQGCNGCWAFGVSNHLSDRFCIKGRDVVLSAQDLLECTVGNFCCRGGNPGNAYRHIMLNGLVDEDCKPFDAQCNECRPRFCRKYRCMINSAWVTSHPLKAKLEIMVNGPIAAIYNVYSDFPYYQSGVYHRTSSKKLSVHSVTIVGWGVTGGTEYWVCKNSWGDNWGMDGYFKIKMGDSEINSYMTSCMPMVV